MQPLDFEARDEYSLKLRVENVNPLSSKAQNLPVSTATVRVMVVNENEAPHFREDPIFIVVPESVPPGTLLKSNYAFDPDKSELRYDAARKEKHFDVSKKSMRDLDRLLGRYEISRDPERWLDINRATGDITAKRSFNMRSPHVRNNIYRAVVKVTGQSVSLNCLFLHI